MTAPATFKYGDIVEHGFHGTGATKAEVLRFERKYRQDGYVVWDLHGDGSYGALRPYPRWVPADALRPVAKDGAK